MKTFKILNILLLFFISLAHAQVNIIPRPMEVFIGDGFFELNNKVAIVSDKISKNQADYLATILDKAFDTKTKIKQKGSGIVLKINPNMETTLGKEGYHLTASKKNILISASSNAGLFYGIQSLRQLLPSDFEFSKQFNKKVLIPQVNITDKPRFGWRSFMLDESRHFKGAEVVKNLLDQMALLKMNVFHWHLTDDQGWRIEIKKYPNLTKVGSYREDTQSSRKSEARYGYPHQGFYTQEEIKGIIAYAEERQIRIVPEIEMPGHAMAAIASYPWLGILGANTKVPEFFGKLDDSFNIADPKVYEFLTDVLEEVFELFPGNVVHIGGDEVMFDVWKNSEMIQNKIKEEGLSSPADLQIFFTNQMSTFMENKNHRMMGWNEILGANVHEWQEDSDVKVEQKLAKSAIVHFWKGNVELINEAVTNGYDIVNSLHSMTYLDYNYDNLPLSKAYSFDPIPEGVEEQYTNKILGLGCQMWSEWIPSVQQMNNQIFPRIAAYAEVGWTSKSNKDYEVFIKSLNDYKKRWEFLGIEYHSNFN
ncbi:beta-N-acetylhexosaminidase [Mariniflexile litorale]|uniref:beta-N-acetylhexosaminidase n=1 Tax=Mariniflexile litorale TaxID=3045158 RepID=A0AAU7EH33_9FLAO|nr:beta-N-acetylhexosaminidase [Mariniflexile sp. KMM 9835]MDQ8209948.1 beta-N-acetylhexosaminidase [Mariniflexile sp. KMM 9835]